jgi:ABC-type glycerol-3-phosphate transport system substrate-binding protein
MITLLKRAAIAFLGAVTLVSVTHAQTELVLPIQVGPEADAHKRLATQYFDETKGRIKIRVEEIARAVHPTKMATALGSKTTEYDVLPFACTMFPLWGAAGWLEPLSDYMADPTLFPADYDLADFPASFMNVLKRGDKLYGFPQELAAYLFMYRTDVLERYGIKPPPLQGWSWDEYIAAGIRLKEAFGRDGVKDMYPTAFAGARNRNTPQAALQNIWGHGGDVLDSGHRPVLTSQPALLGLTSYVDQLTKHKLAGPGVVNYAYSELLTALQEGQAAMAIQWVAAAPTLLDPKKSPKTAGKLGFSVIPYFTSHGPRGLRAFPQCWAVGVSAFSRHKREAFAYIAWFTSKQIARDYVTKGGGSSGRQSLLTDKEVLSSNPQYAALLETAKVFHPTPTIPEWTYILESILTPAFNGALAGAMTPEKALSTASDEIRSYLRKAGYNVN